MVSCRAMSPLILIHRRRHQGTFAQGGGTCWLIARLEAAVLVWLSALVGLIIIRLKVASLIGLMIVGLK